MMGEFRLDEATHLTIDDVVRAAQAPMQVVLSQGVRERMQRSRAVVDAHVGGDIPVYGLNTGLGGNVGHRLTPEEIPAFQEQMVRGRIAGVGEPLPIETCRAALFCRIVGLAKGAAGISPHVHALMVEMLARDVIPVVPSRGSLGTGDLIIMMSVSAVLIGRGRAYVGGVIVPGAQALATAGLQPVELGAKDGLSIANASAATCAMAALSLAAIRSLLSVHVAAAALACEGYGANPRIFDARLAEARPAAGQVAAAALFRHALAGSDLHAGGSAQLVQNAISFRALSQVTGTTLAAYASAKEAVEIELNAAADNPLVLGDDDLVLSTGNFHTASLSLAFETLGLAVAQAAAASVARFIQLTGSGRNGLPKYLSPIGGASAGFVPLQKTATSILAAIRHKANPVMLDFLPVSEGVEDHATQTPLAVSKCAGMIALWRRLIAFEMMAAAQAVDLREGLTLAPRTGAIYAAVRAHVSMLKDDRPLGADAEVLHAMLADGTWQGAATVGKDPD